MNELARRVGVLQGLTATELDTLQLRVRGRSIAEIARAQFSSPEAARQELAHLYDTLWIAHLPAERRAWEFAGWTAALAYVREHGLLADRFLGYVPQPTDEPPSDAALAAVDEDELTLTPAAPLAAAEPSPRRAGFPGWFAGAAALLAIVVVSSLAILAMGDDDEREQGAVAPTSVAGTPTSAARGTATPTSGAGLGVATATATATVAPSPSATRSAPSVTPAASASPTPRPTRTPTVASTRTPASTATTAATRTATATATATASPTPETPVVPPTPVVIYSADWSQGLGDWTVGDGWRAENAMLVFDGPGGSASATTTVDIAGRDYAIDAEILVTNGAYSSAVGGFALQASTAGGTSDWQAVTLVSTGTVHRYRIEVRGQQATFLVDDVVVGQANDPRYRTPDALGVYIVGTHAEVHAFRVVSLE